jgi:hypothetical protein
MESFIAAVFLFLTPEQSYLDSEVSAAICSVACNDFRGKGNADIMGDIVLISSKQ